MTTPSTRAAARGRLKGRSTAPKPTAIAAHVANWREKVAAIVNAGRKGAVRLDLAAGTVKYADAIKSHRAITAITGGEEIVRAFFIHRLVEELDYRPESLTLEEPYQAGRAGGRGDGKQPRIDAYLVDRSDTPFYFAELKDPDEFERDKGQIETQLFSVAALHTSKTGKAPRFLVYYTLEFANDVPRDKPIIIDYAKYPTYRAWTDAGSPSVGNELSAKFDKPRKTPYTKGGERDLATSFTVEEIGALATDLHNVLWGGGSTGDTDVFASLVNIILAKIQDEDDTDEGEEYRFQLEQHGDEIEPPVKLFERINQLYRRALADKFGKTGSLESSFVVDQEKFSLSKLVYTVQRLEKYSLVDGKNSLDGRDILGDFFEQIQRAGFRQSKGQFFTPGNIVRFMLYALELDQLALSLLNTEKRLPYVIDPSCGSGTFLIETMRIVTYELKRRQLAQVSRGRGVQNKFVDLFQPDHQEHKWAREFLYGIEHNFELATAAKVNMILHGDGSANIFHKDGLKPFRFYKRAGSTSPSSLLEIGRPNALYREKEANEKFDVAVSNPPFSVDLDDDTKQFLNSEFLFGKKKNSENLFLERYWQLLAPGGRLGVVLPESVFDTTENRYARLFLFKYFRVTAVVSLPQVAFEPHTQTKTSLLFALKKAPADVEAWQAAWDGQVKVYTGLRTRVEDYVAVFRDGASQSRYPSIKHDDDATVRERVSAFLDRPLSDDESSMPLPSLIGAVAGEIAAVAATDNDAVEEFGRVNLEWVFRAVARQANYEFPVYEARGVGYKRRKKNRELPQPNDLFDLELAPTTLDLAAVREYYGDEIRRARDEVAAVSAKFAELPQAPGDGGADAAGAERAKLGHRLKAARERERQVLAEWAAVEPALATYYDDQGTLRPAYVERLDPDLRKLFLLDRLARWRSTAVVLRSGPGQTILDDLRHRRVWQ